MPAPEQSSTRWYHLPICDNPSAERWNYQTPLEKIHLKTEYLGVCLSPKHQAPEAQAISQGFVQTK
eukprot:5389996-Amphidinium_carterae.1